MTEYKAEFHTLCVTQTGKLEGRSLMKEAIPVTVNGEMPGFFLT